ncbi:hypothetical protein MLD38_009456 [Melastoma candidum]|uniref:Uncharacterized protein n=1 Tax=Melastoma candidum TaxID=119954 RepID=A0ACB9S1B1_9MYRT|nr:hypothetical protein MLD38_009456 [Melastoma candidum]
MAAPLPAISSSSLLSSSVLRRPSLRLTTRASGAGDFPGNKKAVPVPVPVPVPNANYVVPLDEPFSSPSYSSFITRPLVEILRDLNKRIPDDVLVPRPDHDRSSSPYSLPWFHANRMMSFYAPGWCGEVQDVIYSDAGSVSVLYRVTIRGSDGEAHREATGTVSANYGKDIGDPVAAAEEIAFCRACARFGLGLYLYHEEQVTLH